MKPYRSSYDAFDNSPLLKIDPAGDDDYYNSAGKYVGSDGQGTAIRLFRGSSVTQFNSKLSEVGPTEMKNFSREITIQSNDQFSVIMKDIKEGSTRDNYEHKAYIVLNTDPNNPTLSLEVQPKSEYDNDAHSENIWDDSHLTDEAGKPIPFKSVHGNTDKVILGQVHGHPDKNSHTTGGGRTKYSRQELLPKTSEDDGKTAKILGVPVYGVDYTNNVHKVDPDKKTSTASSDNSILRGSLEQTGGTPAPAK